MDKKKYQVFISSTYTDLIEARKKVQETILSMYQFPIGMEMFSAGDDEQWEVIKETIDSSDYYVLIIGHRYGSETSEGISYTEKEYDYAKENDIPILAFIRDRDVSLRADERESEQKKIRKLESFIKKAMSNKMCEFWNTKDDLALKVSVALNKQFNRKQRPGWIRANNIDFTEISNELMKLSQENRKLREENENLKSKLIIKKPIINLEINKGEELRVEYPQKYNYVNNEFKALNYEDIPEELQKYITGQEIEEYNKLLPKKEEINEYLEKKIEFSRIKNTGKNINIKILNNGSLKANDIYIDIKFPKEIKVMNIEDIEELEEPKKLDIPENPIEKAEKEYYKESFPQLGGFSNIANQFMKLSDIRPNYGQKRIQRLLEVTDRNRLSWIDNNTIKIRLNSLMHTHMKLINEKYKIIPLESGKYEVKINIMCEEYEKNISYSIPVINEEI